MFHHWEKQYGRRSALDKMKRMFGYEYPKKGMFMGTHSRYPDRWLINGIIRLDEVRQQILF